MTSIDFVDQGLEQGRLSINLCPCSSSGKVLSDEQFVDQPEELIGKPYSFKVHRCDQFIRPYSFL